MAVTGYASALPRRSPVGAADVWSRFAHSRPVCSSVAENAQLTVQNNLLFGYRIGKLPL
jgi:hypothetical protein